jgi:hypothetical protein
MSVETKLHVDESAGNFTFQRVQDVEDILDLNKQLQATTQNADWGRHVARIPNIFLEQWLNEEYVRGNVGLRMYTPEFDKLIERKLQDPDWRFLRVDDRASTGFLGFGS